MGWGGRQMGWGGAPNGVGGAPNGVGGAPNGSGGGAKWVRGGRQNGVWGGRQKENFRFAPPPPPVVVGKTLSRGGVNREREKFSICTPPPPPVASYTGGGAKMPGPTRYPFFLKPSTPLLPPHMERFRRPCMMHEPNGRPLHYASVDAERR